MMISHTQIARLIESREFEQLIHRVLANGRCRSRVAERLLASSGAAAVCAIGLGLQRLSEITYRPTSTSYALAAQLLSHQQNDGTFSDFEDAGEPSRLVSTAVAVRGLIALVAQHRAAGLEVHPIWQAAVHRGICALAQRSERSDVLKHSAEWAIAVWQLGDSAEFRRCVSVSSLLHTLDDTSAEVAHDELCRYAHAMAA